MLNKLGFSQFVPGSGAWSNYYTKDHSVCQSVWILLNIVSARVHSTMLVVNDTSYVIPEEKQVV